MTTFPSFARITLFLILCIHCLSDQASCENTDRITYIVHVHKPPPDHAGSHRDWHEAFLPQPRISSDGGLTDSRLVYSYTHALSGFAARLTAEELEAMREMDGFLHAEPDVKRASFLTTHTPSFLGLYPGPNNFWGGAAGYGRGVIIGVVDSGIDPSHPSFTDDGMAPPPPRWKGKCEFGNKKFCNKKLIGARIFDHQNVSVNPEPFDPTGHGTHVAGTAAGRFVANASVLGAARGTAAGIAPEAWLAVYKVGDMTGATTADFVAAIDSAVADGVDVLSLSLRFVARNLYDDPLGIASFGAIRKGVFVSAGAGNEGPFIGTVANTAPWMLTVGASTIDRRIRSVVVLGNGEELEGQSAYQPTNFTSSSLPLVVPFSADDPSASFCHNHTLLQSMDVKGKLVICMQAADAILEKANSNEKGAAVQKAGGAGMVLVNPATRGLETRAGLHNIPTSEISNFDWKRIQRYLLAAALAGTNATASMIFKGTEIGPGAAWSAPAVATFSSRGPSTVNPGILKPDIIGPGVDILAAFPKVNIQAGQLEFVFMPGTSMSCPHLSGVAALLKNTHPNWTPAMIKSAIMTTADLTNLRGAPITDLLENRKADFFATGSGHVNPVKANNPGLVYDIKIDDYINYLCGLGFTDKQVSMITMERTTCSAYRAIIEADLNYPSLTVDFRSPTKPPSRQATRRVSRTVINVGQTMSSYKVRVNRPPGVLVTVQPEILYFTEVGQQQSFLVTFELNSLEPPPTWFSEGLLTWVSNDAKITVNSPISVLFGKPSA